MKMTTLWRIELLGWLRAVREEQVISRFRTQKAGALLAYLAFHQQRSHPREELIEILWPEEAPATGRERLRTALFTLRRQLEPPGVPPGAVLVATRAAVQLNPAACATDTAAFEEALQAARSRNGRERALRLQDALALYRGELLPGYFEAWVLPERERLAEARRQALRELARHFEREGDYAHAVDCARQAIAADPLCEETQEELRRLLAASGHPEAAVQQHPETAQLLREWQVTTPVAVRSEPARNGRRRPRVDPAPEAPDIPFSPAAAAVPPAIMRPAPGDTITFLLAEIVPARLRQDGDGEEPHTAAEAWHARLTSILAAHGGGALPGPSDPLAFAFGRAGDALAAAVAAQECVLRSSYSVSEGLPDTPGERSDTEYGIRTPLRMALHTGDVETSEDQYDGPALDHAIRLLRAAHPGQLLISGLTARLIRESGEPGARLVDLGRYHLRPGDPPERLFQIEPCGGSPGPFPPPNAIPAPAAPLPAPLTRFFGREEEIAQLVRALGPRPSALGNGGPGFTDGRGPAADSPRLITLTGPGGSGKTRLCLETARRLQAAWADRVPARGCWFVPLADLFEPQRIADRIRDALRLPRSPGQEPLEQVVEALAAQPTLLLLDNCEQLLPHAAPLVQCLLRRVSTLQIMVTSRRRLGLPARRCWPSSSGASSCW